MREIRLSGSVEGVVSNHDPYSDCFAVTADLAAFPAGKARTQCTYIVMR